MKISDEKIEIKMPIYTAEELTAIDKSIMTDFDNLVDTAIKHIYRDRECIVLQKIIKKQQEELNEEKEKNKKKDIIINLYKIMYNEILKENKENG